MVAQILPAIIIGAVVLIALGKLNFPKSSAQKERDAEVDEKGAGGALIDDLSGEGASDALKADLTNKGAAGVALDGLLGQGQYKKLTTEIDKVEKARVATLDGFNEFVASAERGRQEIVAQIGAGAAKFGADAQAALKDVHPAAFGIFGLPGIIAGQIGGERGAN